MKLWLQIVGVALVCLALGLSLALWIIAGLLHAPESHGVTAVKYLLTSGLVSLVLGTLALVAVSRFAPSLGLKIGLACVFGSAAAIINVVVMPLLMFSERSDVYILVATLVYFAAIALAFAYIVARVATMQIRSLRDGALRLASGSFGTQVPVEGADEVADLARAFNHMSAQLNADVEQRKQLEDARRDLIAAVSHDLRTPVASIRAMVEAINDGVVSEPAEVRRYLGLVQRETERLGRLIDDLFELSRIESGSLDLRLARVPIAELVRETVEGLRFGVAEKGIELEERIAPDLPTRAIDAQRMQRVLVNLIQNAVRHTPAGGMIRVDVAPQDGHVLLAVTDSGEGIPAEEQPYIFDQFYRSEKSRSRDTGGAGLGLAIARGIVEAHHGTIGVESEPGAGARFVVTL